MTPPQTTSFLLEELVAPEGWAAAFLHALYPVPDDDLRAYRKAAGDVVEHLFAPLAATTSEEVLLTFQFLRPRVEMEAMRTKTRLWLPEIGVGVWLDREPPTTWTAEEFENAEPGKMRPMVDRVVRIHRDRVAQSDAWLQTLGSGAATRWAYERGRDAMTATTELLESRMVDRSVLGFPFYVPLLTLESLRKRNPAYDEPWDDLLPGVQLVASESTGDGGLLLLGRDREAFHRLWNRPPTGIAVERVRPIEESIKG